MLTLHAIPKQNALLYVLVPTDVIKKKQNIFDINAQGKQWLIPHTNMFDLGDFLANVACNTN